MQKNKDIIIKDGACLIQDHLQIYNKSVSTMAFHLRCILNIFLISMNKRCCSAYIIFCFYPNYSYLFLLHIISGFGREKEK